MAKHMADLPASDTPSNDSDNNQSETMPISPLDTLEIDLSNPDAMEEAAPVDVEYEVVE